MLIGRRVLIIKGELNWWGGPRGGGGMDLVSTTKGQKWKEQILVTHKRKPCKHTEIEMTGEEKKLFSSTDSAVVEA